MNDTCGFSRRNAEYYSWLRESLMPYALEAGLTQDFDLDRIWSSGPPTGLVTFTISKGGEGATDVTFRKEDIDD